MGTVKKNGLMKVNIKESMRTELKVGVGRFIGRTRVHMKAIGSKTNFAAPAHINGKTVESTRENGKTIRCMDKGFILGQMAQSSQVSI